MIFCRICQVKAIQKYLIHGSDLGQIWPNKWTGPFLNRPRLVGRAWIIGMYTQKYTSAHQTCQMKIDTFIWKSNQCPHQIIPVHLIQILD